LHSNKSKHCQTISTAQKVTKRIGDLALEIMAIMGGIGNNVTGRPVYVIATTLKPGYLRTTHESTFYPRCYIETIAFFKDSAERL